MARTWNLKFYITSKLRQVFLFSPLRKEVAKRAEIKKGWWRCERCKRKVEKIKIDHIDPVIEVSKGFVSWDTYIERLFCSASNLQAICTSCHEKKTKEEQKQRKKAKK